MSNKELLIRACKDCERKYAGKELALKCAKCKFIQNLIRGAKNELRRTKL